MFPRDRSSKQVALFAAGLGVLVLVGIFILVVSIASSDSSAVTATGAAASDDSGFPFWLLGALIPAMIVPIMAAKANRRDAEKEKNKHEDPTFEKPKREDVHYEVGPDGELIEVFDDEDEVNDYEDRR
jgi:hypothetical protein